MDTQQEAIVDFARLLIRENVMNDTDRLTDSEVDGLSDIEIAGSAEGTIAACVLTYLFLKHLGESDDAEITRRIEDYRCVARPRMDYVPDSIEEYVQKCVSREYELQMSYNRIWCLRD